MKLRIVLSMAVMAVAGLLQAQMPQLPPLPLDPAVRYGKLPNGLTYYIRHNDLPEHHAEFFIAQRVGSVLEEESQRGLAHFLEHMAFNGTKNYPGKGMLDYLQRHGVKFGTNVNAYTSIDETVYNISDVPIDEALHPGIIDSCLLALHDWSGFISLEEKEIDNERGVIHEEWRSRNSASMRMYQNEVLPALIPGNRYAHRMPIGLMSVVDSFTYDELRNYYHKWYRPDLQGIFVVGDVDVDAVEQKITALWQDIQTPADAAERVYYTVEDNVEPLVAVASDPEMTANILSVMYKSDPMPAAMKLSQMGIIQDVMEGVIAYGINQRLSELSQKADCPFMQAYVSFGTYLTAKTKDCFEVEIIFHEGRVKEALQQVMATVRSACTYGLTPSEIQRAKDEILSSIENDYNERDKRKNRQLVNEFKRHFLNDKPMPGVEFEWQMAQQLFPALPDQAFNQPLQQVLTNENVAMYIMAQQKEGNNLPTAEELLAMYREVMSGEAQRFEEKTIAANLIEKAPKAGKIKKVEEGVFGSTIWTLSNGARVIWRKTDFKQDEIQCRISSFGGTDMIEGLSRGEQSYLEDAYTVGGVGQFSATDLNKALAGKQVSCHASVGLTTEGLYAWTTPKDMRSMMQLIHLWFTQPRVDQEAWDAMMSRAQSSMKQRIGTPSKILSDSITIFRYKGQEKLYPLQLEDLEGLDYQKLLKLAEKRFANARDFEFYFIGNIDEDSLRIFTEQYIASLPSKGKVEPRGKEYLPTPGSRELRFDLPMQQPKVTVYNMFQLFNQNWTLKDEIVMSMLGQAGSIIFTNTIREEEGGVYSPHVQGSADAVSKSYTMLYVFETGEDKLAHIEEVAYKQFCKMADDAITEDIFQKVRDYMVKQHQEQVKENSYWMSNIRSYYRDQIDYVTDYENALQSITLDDLKKMAKHVVADADRQVFVANGVEPNK